MTHACKLGLEGIGIEAPWLALLLRPLATLGEEQESGGPSDQARSGGGLDEMPWEFKSYRLARSCALIARTS
jgi:hypothetical protein